MLISLIAGLCTAAAVWLLVVEPSGRLRGLLSRPGPSGGTARRRGLRALLGRAAEEPESSPGQAAAPETRGREQIRLGERRGGPRASRVDLLAFDLDLAAICLQAGLPTERALELAAQAGDDRSGLGRLGRSLELGGAKAEGEPAVLRRDAGSAAAAEALESVASLIEFSRATGVALAPLLRGLGSDLRRAEHRRRQLAAARLGVQLVIPLGVCILPAFILLGVVPVLLTLVSDMAGLFG